MTKSRELSGVTGRIKGRAAAVRAPVTHMLAGSNAREAEQVRWFTRQLDRRGVRQFALIANRLSNGSLYVVILVMFWLAYGLPGAVAGAAAAIAFSHLIYPFIKRYYCRRRPFQFDTTIPSLLPPLDDHSFPSGHMMSCVAVMTPLCLAVPAMLPWMMVTLLIVGWARLAAGHHYPSDLFAGGLLGLMAASLIAMLQAGYG